MKLFHPQSGAFFSYFAGAYPLRTAAMVSLLLIGGILEGFSVIALVPLLEVAAADGAQSDGSGVGAAFQRAIATFGIEPTLPVLVAVVVLGIFFKSAFLWMAMRQVGFTVAKVSLDLRLQFVEALLKARWSYFGSQPVGGFANIITGEAVRSAAAYREACVVMGGVIQLVIYLVVSSLISWPVTAAAALTGLVLIRGLKGFIRMGRTAGESLTRRTMGLARTVVDAMQGIKPMKAMAREELFWPILAGEAEELNHAQRKGIIAAESLRLFQEPVVTLVLGLGLLGLLTATEQTFSSIVVLAFVYYRLMTNINTLQMRYQVMVAGESAFWSLRRNIDEARAAEEVNQGTFVVTELADAIELRDVSFAYGELVVLEGLSLRIPAGSITALIGQSGSGKTTILDIITGLRRPDRGEVFLDGTPLSEVDIMAWRRRIGYVPQDVFLFHDTIRRNVTLGDDSISDERVRKALMDAGAWDFIAREKAELDAVVAPQGSNFSGGQRQRLAIARALVRQPALIILDEATTGLDTRTEAAILETLAALHGRVTILAISHQPALREIADVTIELGEGRVLEEVTH